MAANNPTYNKEDIQILKGFGILIIVLHNYCHWLPGYEIENEFHFSISNIQHLFSEQFSSLSEFIKLNFAFWGHFGVELFIFASGYGLAQHQVKLKLKSYVQYLIPRLAKLYLLLILGMAIVSLARYINDGTIYSWKTIALSFLMRASTYANFRSSTLFDFSGPFWYFGLAAQLYVIYPFCFYSLNNKVNSIKAQLLVLAIILLINSLAFPYFEQHGLAYFGNFMGHLPEFLLGIILANKKRAFKFNIWSTLIFAFISLATQYFEFLFPLSFTAVCLFLLSAYDTKHAILNALPFAKKIFIFLGKISMNIFIINGVLREMSWFRNIDGDLVFGKIWLFIPVLMLISYITNLLFNFLWKYLRRWINLILLRLH